MRDPRFPDFRSWSREYYAMTVSPQLKDVVVNYISNQRQHHSGRDLGSEMMETCGEAGFVYDSRDMNE